MKDLEQLEFQVGERLKFYRMFRKKTRIDMAKALGVSSQQVQKYESGVNRITAGKLIAASWYLKIPLEKFACDEIPTYNKEKTGGRS